MGSSIRRVHEYTVDRAGGGAGVARIVSVNPLMRFVSQSHPPFIWQGGQWFDDGGRPIKETDVPQQHRDHVKNHPPIVSAGSDVPDTLLRCEFCERIDVPSSQYAQHLIESHIKTGKAAEETTPADLPPGEYQTNADGTVKLDRRGAPRRKIGRPKQRLAA